MGSGNFFENQHFEPQYIKHTSTSQDFENEILRNKLQEESIISKLFFRKKQIEKIPCSLLLLRNFANFRDVKKVTGRSIKRQKPVHFTNNLLEHERHKNPVSSRI